jgi:hypothetical protein
MPYQYDFVCTYKLMDSEEEQDELYRIQLMQAFDVEELKADHLNDTMTQLFSQLILNPEFKAIIQQASKNEKIIDTLDTLKVAPSDDFFFTMLFEYNYFDLLHSCIADILMHGSIHPLHFNKIMEALVS